MPQNNFKKRKLLGWVIKIAIVIFALWYLYRQIFVKNPNEDVWDTFTKVLQNPQQSWQLLLIFLLMFVNWSFEAQKWKLLIDKIENIGFFRSLKAVFSGITVSVFTPNRVGEYGGRIFHLETAGRIKAILITIIGSYAQLLVTIITGLVCLLFYWSQFGINEFYFSTGQFVLVVIIVLLIVISLIWLYLNTRILTPVVRRIKFLGKYRKFGKVFSGYRPKELSRVLTYSFLRYAVFTLQYFLLLRLFGLELNYLPAMMMISVTYLAMTIIPTVGITELITRGSVALHFIGKLAEQPVIGIPLHAEIAILTASFSLWLINLAIPAVLGTLFVFNLKFFRKDDK